jgi:hypothetical protein
MSHRMSQSSFLLLTLFFFDALNLELCMELPAISTTTPQQSPPAQHQNHSTTATAKTTSPAP